MATPTTRQRFAPARPPGPDSSASGGGSRAVEELDKDILAAGFHPVPFRHPLREALAKYFPTFLGAARNPFFPLAPDDLRPRQRAPSAGEDDAASSEEALNRDSAAVSEPKKTPRIKSPPRLLHTVQPHPAQAAAAAAPPRIAHRASAWLALACLAIGGLLGYSLRQFSSARVDSRENNLLVETPGKKAITPLAPSVQEELDAAYAAQKNGKYAEAKRLFIALQSKHPGWGALNIELAITDMLQQDLSAAQTSLEVMIDKGIMPAEAYFHLGVLYTIRKDFLLAESRFASAVALDPNRPDFYYFWGECLHQEGKPLEAIGKFRSALLRNQFEASASIYRLKLWLCEVQADQENADGSGEQMAAALARPHPPMEAVFAAAARDIKAGNIPSAADRLRRAREIVTPEVFFVVMRDPVFLQEGWRPELAEFYKG